MKSNNFARLIATVATLPEFIMRGDLPVMNMVFAGERTVHTAAGIKALPFYIRSSVTPKCFTSATCRLVKQ